MKVTMRNQMSLKGLEYLISPSFEKRIDAAVGKTADGIVDIMKKDIRKPKRGMASPNNKRKKIKGAGGNVVSAPGESPASQLKELENSITAARVALFTWDIKVGVYYGYYLEYGTTNRGGGVKMLARPFFWKNINIGVKQISVNVAIAFKSVPETRVK